jgi:CAAX prenyl protease-like protein
VIVPIVEELAFRGLLYRWVISRDFQTVAFDRLSWVALGVSSALFGLLHSRPVAGALAGAVFALVMVRTGRLSDAIASHIAANAIIIAWAIAVGQWTLL